MSPDETSDGEENPRKDVRGDDGSRHKGGATDGDTTESHTREGEGVRVGESVKDRTRGEVRGGTDEECLSHEAKKQRNTKC